MKKGFTLIELMIVIAIIMILIALLVPAIKMVQDSAKNSLQRQNELQAQADKNELAIQAHLKAVAEIRAHQPPPTPPKPPPEAITTHEDGIAKPEENPNFKTIYNSHNTHLNIDYTMVVDQETGVEYIIVRTANGGVTITPRFHQDKIDTDVEKK